LFLLSDGLDVGRERSCHVEGRAPAPAGPLWYQTGLAGTDIGALNHLVEGERRAVFSAVGESDRQGGRGPGEARQLLAVKVGGADRSARGGQA
jgi:hypothetical protein